MALQLVKEKEKKFNLDEINHVLAIAAGKGGVGKSTLTVNLSFALQRLGFCIGVLDGDVYGPSLRQMIPEDLLPSQIDRDIISPAMYNGLKMISIAHFKEKIESYLVRAPIATAFIAQFIHQIDWGFLDYLMIDFPPGTGDVQLSLIQEGAPSAAIIVTTPQEVALLDVRKSIEMFLKMNVPILGVVENMSFFVSPETGEKHYLFGKEGGRRLAEEYRLDFLGEIAIDPLIGICSDQGVCILDAYPESAASVAFFSIAKKIRDRMVPIEKEREKALKNFTLVWR
jgi:ATP-binding protein involved in chromosome partitioning